MERDQTLDVCRRSVSHSTRRQSHLTYYLSSAMSHEQKATIYASMKTTAYSLAVEWLKLHQKTTLDHSNII